MYWEHLVDERRGVPGPDPVSRTCTSIGILNRIVALTSEGYDLEADRRHVEFLSPWFVSSSFFL